MALLVFTLFTVFTTPLKGVRGKGQEERGRVPSTWPGVLGTRTPLPRPSKSTPKSTESQPNPATSLPIRVLMRRAAGPHWDKESDESEI